LTAPTGYPSIPNPLLIIYPDIYPAVGIIPDPLYNNLIPLTAKISLTYQGKKTRFIVKATTEPQRAGTPDLKDPRGPTGTLVDELPMSVASRITAFEIFREKDLPAIPIFLGRGARRITILSHFGALNAVFAIVVRWFREAISGAELKTLHDRV
jgi:hypothetical protein